LGNPNLVSNKKLKTMDQDCMGCILGPAVELSRFRGVWDVLTCPLVG
jgi:hypothetical protein